MGYRKRRAGNAGAVASLALASALVALVLPSALRPPPDQAQSSAALSPDAPPEDEAETIIQSLQQAASRTAGSTGGDTRTTVPVTTTSTVVLPSRGLCFGDPPRQTESAYAPPCRAAFTGDNGGATYRNVTADEVRVGFWATLGMPSQRGEVPTTPEPGEDAAGRTVRVLQQYFNERYELYGRRLQLVALPSPGDGEAGQRAQAVEADTEFRTFVGVHIFAPFCDELTRRELPCYSGNGMPRSVYAEHEPYWFSYAMDIDSIDSLSAEYACKKLVDGTADFAGEGTRGEPRRIAVVTESYAGNGFRSAQNVRRGMVDQCGFEPQLVLDVDSSDASQVALAVNRLIAEDITTALLVGEITMVAPMFAAADAQRYFPEWVMTNSYGMDLADGGRLLSPTQRTQIFGLGGYELPRTLAETDCSRAYKTIDPANDPDANFCKLHFQGLEQVVAGLQEAGPTLTPQSFRDGLYSLPLRPPRYPWAVGGDYGPGDHAFLQDFVEIWWDESAQDPDGGEQGTYRHTANGRRWAPGEMDTTIRAFREGVTGWAEAQAAGAEPA